MEATGQKNPGIVQCTDKSLRSIGFWVRRHNINTQSAGNHITAEGLVGWFHHTLTGNGFLGRGVLQRSEGLRDWRQSTGLQLNQHVLHAGYISCGCVCGGQINHGGHTLPGFTRQRRLHVPFVLQLRQSAEVQKGGNSTKHVIIQTVSAAAPQRTGCFPFAWRSATVWRQGVHSKRRDRLADAVLSTTAPARPFLSVPDAILR